MCSADIGRGAGDQGREHVAERRQRHVRPPTSAGRAHHGRRRPQRRRELRRRRGAVQRPGQQPPTRCPARPTATLGRCWRGGMGSSAAGRLPRGRRSARGTSAPAATVTPSPSGTPGATATPTTGPPGALALTVQPASVKVRKRKTFTFSVTSAGAPVAGASRPSLLAGPLGPRPAAPPRSASVSPARARKPSAPPSRASRRRWPPSASRSGSAVLVVGHVPAPAHDAARVIHLLHRQVDHEAVGRRAVPVVLAGLEEDAVARADLLDRAALALAEADALGDEDRLAERVGVPGGAGAGGEVDVRGGRASEGEGEATTSA